MSLSGTIRRGDRQPLGSPEQVKTQLAKAFPGTQFILVRDGGFIRPSGFNLTSLLIWSRNAGCGCSLRQPLRTDGLADKISQILACQRSDPPLAAAVSPTWVD